MNYSKTWLTIANKALAILGNSLLEDLNDGSNEANYVNTLLPSAIEKVISIYDWRCLRTRASLSMITDVPVYGYAYKFALPTDLARLIEVSCDEDWSREGNYILTDAEEVNVTYIRLPDQPTEMTQEVNNVIALQLAYDYCNSTTSNSSLKSQLYSELNTAIQTAQRSETQAEDDEGVFTLDYLGAR